MMLTPLKNAAAAALYIILIVLGIFYGGPFVAPEDSVFIPMAMLSLLVLSVATMAFLFFFEPLRLLIEGEAHASARFFLWMLGYFASFTALFIALICAAPLL